MLGFFDDQGGLSAYQKPLLPLAPPGPLPFVSFHAHYIFYLIVLISAHICGNNRAKNESEARI